MKSTQAQAAALIRAHLKKQGIKASVTSSSACMTNSVQVKLTDQPPAVVKSVKEYVDQYQYGHFDVMNDMYEYSNSRNDIPQVKYTFVDNETSKEITLAAWEFLKNKYPGNAQHLPDDYDDASRKQWSSSDWCYEDLVEMRVRNIVHGYGHGLDKTNSEEFWAAQTAAPEVPTAASVDGVTIEEHTHTKKGFQMFICIISDRVDRDEYLNLLDRAKSLGGWYSRKWGTTPAGFAFKERAAAEQFADSGSASSPAARVDHSAKLRAIADTMTPQIENKLSDRLTNTPKRLAQAASARLEGERLQRTQTVLYALADLHEAGKLPPELAEFTSKKSVYDMMNTKKAPVANGYHRYYICTGEPGNDSPLWALVSGKTDEERTADELRRDIDGLQFSNIPGYFPTPDDVIDKMLEYAKIEAGGTVLEPSAGSGAIADRIECRTLHCCERNVTLSSILTRKGLDVVSDDFMEYDAPDTYDAIIMNPPFENKQDIKHIQHAIECLKPGGVLVAICANGPNQQKELTPIANHWEELPQGAFKASGTMVNTAMIVIYK